MTRIIKDAHHKRCSSNCQFYAQLDRKEIKKSCLEITAFAWKNTNYFTVTWVFIKYS